MFSVSLLLFFRFIFCFCFVFEFVVVIVVLFCFVLFFGMGFSEPSRYKKNMEPLREELCKVGQDAYCRPRIVLLLCLLAIKRIRALRKFQVKLMRSVVKLPVALG